MPRETLEHITSVACLNPALPSCGIIQAFAIRCLNIKDQKRLTYSSASKAYFTRTVLCVVGVTCTAKGTKSERSNLNADATNFVGGISRGSGGVFCHVQMKSDGFSEVPYSLT
ncbi:hypothetical protein BaRGS_00001121 [Batillaria attramentaria]|uniref:Uncharacterized protein n=1 Tax=Batillaria attramentaria TaxID=370345 RepID=A0ABD0M6X9_9CAEN